MEINSILANQKTRFQVGTEILMTQADINCLASLANAASPETAVEIGCWSGGSSRIISCFAKRLYCIDHWMEDPTQHGFFVPGRFAKQNPRDKFIEFCRNMEGYLHVSIFPCVGPSETWAAVWRVPIDFLFIDGDHTYEGCKGDILGFGKHVRPGGIIAGHDYGEWADAITGEPREFLGVRKAVDEIFPNATIHLGTKIWSVVKV